MMQVTLQPLELADSPSLAILANHPLISQNMRDAFPYPYTMQHAVQFVDSSLIQEKDQFAVHRGIFWDNVLAGCIGVTFQPDVYRCAAEIGYWLGKDFWGQGIAAEALRQMSSYVMAVNSRLHRLYAGIFDRNLQSQKVAQKAGYMLESIQRMAAIKDDELLDVHVYVLLRQQGAE